MSLIRTHCKIFKHEEGLGKELNIFVCFLNWLMCTYCACINCTFGPTMYCTVSLYRTIIPINFYFSLSLSRVRSHAPSIRSYGGTKVVWPDFQPMRASEEPVYIDLFRQNPESVATLPPFSPIEGQKWFDQISSQWESQKNRFALTYFGKIQFLPPRIWILPFVSTASVFTSLQLKYPVHVVPPLKCREKNCNIALFFCQRTIGLSSMRPAY